MLPMIAQRPACDREDVPGGESCTEEQVHDPVEEVWQFLQRGDAWRAEGDLKPIWSGACHDGQQADHDRGEKGAAEDAPCPGSQERFHVDSEKQAEGLGQLRSDLYRHRIVETLARGCAG